jgi:LysM repeat protein
MGVLRFHGVLMAAALALAAGCQQGGRAPVDEKRDPYFLTGQKRKRQGDYAGAVQAYQVALERNPRSGAAHLELGLLYENDILPPRPAIAVYHYSRYLALRPDSAQAEFIRGRIRACKLELVRVMLNTAGAQPAQRERELLQKLEQLGAENQRLRHLIQHPGQAPVPAPATNQPAAGPSVRVAGGPSPAPAAPAPKVHRVKPGENPSSIARQHGIKLQDLLAANPGIRPSRLQINQALKIPPPR